MPIYEYKCRDCGHQFEKIVRLNESPDCVSCQGANLEKLFSAPGISTEKSRRVTESQARQAQQAVRRDQAHAQLEYHQKHLHHHD